MPVEVEERVRGVVNQLGKEVHGAAQLAQREVGEGQNAKVHFLQLHDEVGAVSPWRVQVVEIVLLCVLVLADDEGDFEGRRAPCAGYV